MDITTFDVVPEGDRMIMEFSADEIPSTNPLEADGTGTVLWNIDLEETFADPLQSTTKFAPVQRKIDDEHRIGAKKKVKAATLHRKRTSPYTEPFLQSMLANIRGGTMSMYQVDKYYGIPRATLQYRLGENFRNKGRTGPDPVLSPEEEKIIVEWLQTMERRGFPITRNALVVKVAAYLRENPRTNPCRNNVPGRKWLEGFMRRHPQLTLRTPEAVTSASAKVSEQDIRKWFQTVENYLIENNLADALKDPSRILNGDETGFCMNSSPKKVLATKGAKNVPLVDTQNGKQNVTVLFSFAADGTIIPPDVILPYKRLSREIVQSFPPDWGLGTSDSGWMNSLNFTLYIKKVLYPSLVRRKVKFPVLYFVDGHTSHTAFEAADACSKLGIILIALYPNATRIIQPADVSIFRPLKNSWGKVVEIWKTENMAERLSIPTFGSLLRETMQNAFKTSTILNAFRVCGLFPFNPDAVDYSKCIPDSHFQLKPALESPKTTALPMVEGLMTLVPTTAIESALRMIGDEKIKLYKFGDQNSFSNEDKALSFIYSNILVAGQSTSDEFSYNNEHSYEDPNDDLETAFAEPLILLEEGIERDLQFNSDSVPENHTPFWIENLLVSSEPVVHQDPDQEEEVSNYDFHAPILEDEVDWDNDLQQHPCSVESFKNPSVTETLISDTGPTTLFSDIVSFFDSSNIPPTSASKFFEAPPTPKRNPKHRFYKQKSYAILTAGERLQELRQVEINKAEAAKLKLERAEKRKQEKLKKEAAANARAEEKENVRKTKELKKEAAANARAGEKENAKKSREKEREKKKTETVPSKRYKKLVV